MALKVDPDRLLIAVFIVFLIGASVTIFAPNITAAATVPAQGDGLPFILLWVLPLFVIIAVVMFCAYRGIRTCRVIE